MSVLFTADFPKSAPFKVTASTPKFFLPNFDARATLMHANLYNDYMVGTIEPEALLQAIEVARDVETMLGVTEAEFVSETGVTVVVPEREEGYIFDFLDKLEKLAKFAEFHKVTVSWS